MYAAVGATRRLTRLQHLYGRLAFAITTASEGMAVAAASNCCALASVRSHPIHIMLPTRLSASVVRSCASFLSPIRCRVVNRGPSPVIHADLRSSHGSFSTLGPRKGVLCREPAPRHKSRNCRLDNDRHLATLAQGIDAYQTSGQVSGNQRSQEFESCHLNSHNSYIS